MPVGASIAVIGAGRGHDAIEAARLGYRVTAIDFAPEALKGIAENASKAGVQLETRLEDVFALKGPFDAVLEHTCFCAIDVERRAEYVEAVARALKPGGTLFGVFYAHGREGGPPFDVTEAEVRRLFSKRFKVERLLRAPDGFPGTARVRARGSAQAQRVALSRCRLTEPGTRPHQPRAA